MNKVYLSIVTFTILSLSVTGLHAQSPGGISTNLSLWLKANNTSTLSPTTGSLNTWTYSNNGSNQFTAPGGAQPTVQANTFNFLPSIAFNGTQYMTGPAGVGAPLAAGSLAYSVFVVWQSSTAVGGANQRIWAERPNSNAFDNNFDGVSMWVYPSGPTYGDQPEISPFLTGVAYAPSYNTYMLPYVPNTPYISQLNLLHQDINDLEVMDQTNYTTGPFVTSTDPLGTATLDRFLSNGANILGARSTSIDEPFIGNVSEVIVYDTSLGAMARTQIFSYLSLKYGIPLAGTYFSSTGANIWDQPSNSSWGTANLNYTNSVFGIGQDNNSGLLNTQSNSSVTGTGSGAGISGMGNIVLSNPSSLSDQSFMIIGSNNAGLTETTTNLPLAAPIGSERLATQWLVQTSGTPGTVNLSFDFTGLTVTGAIGTTADFRLLVDEDGDGDFTTGFVSYIAPSSFNGNIANFTGVNLSQNTKVVIAILSNAAAGTPLPVNFVNVTAQPSGADVDLNWTVGANEEAKDYQVQHSVDGATFTTIGDVANVLNQTSYSFVHSNAGAGMHYYRILETDEDGAQVYSKIVSANLSASEFSIRMLNNPVTGSQDAEIELSAFSGGSASLEVFTLGGARVATLMEQVPAGTTRIKLPTTGLAAGTYAVKIRVNDVTHVVQVVKL